MSTVGGAHNTRADKATKSLDFARCELRALRRRAAVDPRFQTPAIERSVKEVATLMQTVSAQLRALSAQGARTKKAA